MGQSLVLELKIIWIDQCPKFLKLVITSAFVAKFDDYGGSHSLLRIYKLVKIV